MSAILKLPSLAERYTWEAEQSDGSIISKGGDLSDSTRISFIPADGTGLSRHDICGVTMKRRFMRAFKRSTVGGFDKAAYWRQIEAQQSDARRASRAARDARQGPPKVDIPPPHVQRSDEYLQVVVCAGFRFYLRHSDGVVFIGPEDYEVYF